MCIFTDSFKKSKPTVPYSIMFTICTVWSSLVYGRSLFILTSTCGCSQKLQIYQKDSHIGSKVEPNFAAMISNLKRKHLYPSFHEILILNFQKSKFDQDGRHIDSEVRSLNWLKVKSDFATLICYLENVYGRIFIHVNLKEVFKPSPLPPVFQLLLRALIVLENNVTALFDISYTEHRK